MMPTWNARAQVVIDAGAPVAIAWNQGSTHGGLGHPEGRAEADCGTKFIQFTADAKRQAQSHVEASAIGPTNPKAYDYIPSERAKYLPTRPTTSS